LTDRVSASTASGPLRSSVAVAHAMEHHRAVSTFLRSSGYTCTRRRTPGSRPRP